MNELKDMLILFIALFILFGAFGASVFLWRLEVKDEKEEKIKTRKVSTDAIVAQLMSYDDYKHGSGYMGMLIGNNRTILYFARFKTTADAIKKLADELESWRGLASKFDLIVLSEGHELIWSQEIGEEEE